MQDFRNLKVWKKSHTNVLDIYRITKSFPNTEQFGLTSQMRRAAASIPANLAEGCGKGSDADFGRYLNIAMGSLHETHYFLILSKDLELVTKRGFQYS